MFKLTTGAPLSLASGGKLGSYTFVWRSYATSVMAAMDFPAFYSCSPRAAQSTLAIRSSLPPLPYPRIGVVIAGGLPKMQTNALSAATAVICCSMVIL
jgi:hypothetical protein